MNISKNDEIKLKIESLTSEGSGVGHYGGIAVFVRGTVPGDEIICHIIKTSKRYCVGITGDIVIPSLSRIKSGCPVSSKCGGCSFRNMTYDEELKYKQSRVKDALERIGHIDAPVNKIIAADKIDFYRNKAQYPVYIENGVLHAGFYAYKSHRIIECENCRLQDKAFKSCLDAFGLWVKKANITSYDEKTGRGILRHIYLRRTSLGEIMACAVINGNSLPEPEILAGELKKNPGMKSVCFNINKKAGNVILGEKTVVVWGKGAIRDRLLENEFEISPNSFYQVNHDQCERLYTAAKKYASLTGNETVVDLYCGAGTIGLSMAREAGRIFGIEIVPQAVENARNNARLNNISNARYFCGDALDGAKELERRGIKSDVVILDPPRKGCKKELFDVIERMSPKKIVYVSCDSSTLARDLAILNEKGYNTKEVTPVDMFPRTPHVEAVALILKDN